MLHCLKRKGCNKIIGFVSLHFNGRHGHEVANLLKGFKLRAKLLGHWWSISLIGIQNFVSKVFSFGIKNHNDFCFRIFFFNVS